jgi:alkylmercury lyase
MAEGTELVDRLSKAVAEGMPELNSDEARIVINLYRLLAKGEPVKPSEVATESGIVRELVDKRLEEWPGVFSHEGAVIGFWGLAIPEMSHRFEVDGSNLYTWCAYDALFLPELIGKIAKVRSQDPVTGEEITLTVHPDRIEDPNPEETVMSFLDPATTRFDENVILNFCNYVHFFASRESGSDWILGKPGTFLLSLDQSFQLARRANRAKFGEALEALTAQGGSV